MGDRNLRSPSSFSMVKIKKKNPHGNPKLPSMGRLSSNDSYFLRKSVLWYSPRGALALLAGGIIWHLAMDYSDPSRIAQILDSGGFEAIKDGIIEIEIPKSQATFHQYVLSPEEVDLICGVYHIIQEPGKTPKQISWWPRPNAWAHSGLDLGYWSSECESWYEEMLNRINEGTAKLRTSHDWKRALTRNKKTQKFLKKMRDTCSNTLEQIY
ncbi:hypothetical protein M422DRAFT_264603 [Sphaerobolus stellatus SS14]|uniref:Uncharacterized protein n=1 Tax=Sphaerobolus stellatus (strain SS14) TaxID=990650 RepID=A0A0C9V7V3_SPHS4|nr:hypothetical protein M422DRAFT_264603 [Sphaerobolus stellatus SS14]